MSVTRDCPCCGAKDEFDERGSLAICINCGWEDDDAQEVDATLPEGANAVSLKQARENYRQVGFSDPDRRAAGRVAMP